VVKKSLLGSRCWGGGGGKSTHPFDGGKWAHENGRPKTAKSSKKRKKKEGRGRGSTITLQGGSNLDVNHSKSKGGYKKNKEIEGTEKVQDCRRGASGGKEGVSKMSGRGGVNSRVNHSKPHCNKNEIPVPRKKPPPSRSPNRGGEQRKRG